MSSAPSSPAETLRGTLERLVYQSSDASFAVARLRVPGTRPVT